jgi:hypothetical protein
VGQAPEKRRQRGTSATGSVGQAPEKRRQRGI